MVIVLITRSLHSLILRILTWGYAISCFSYCSQTTWLTLLSLINTSRSLWRGIVLPRITVSHILAAVSIMLTAVLTIIAMSSVEAIGWFINLLNRILLRYLVWDILHILLTKLSSDWLLNGRLRIHVSYWTCVGRVMRRFGSWWCSVPQWNNSMFFPIDVNNLLIRLIRWSSSAFRSDWWPTPLNNFLVWFVSISLIYWLILLAKNLLIIYLNVLAYATNPLL